MKAQEAKNRSMIAQKEIVRKKNEYAEKPLNIFQQLRMKYIWKKIRRASLKGKQGIAFLFALNPRIVKRLMEDGYKVESDKYGVVIWW